MKKITAGNRRVSLPDRIESEAFAAMEQAGVPVRRKLRRAERVAVPEIGISGVTLEGSGVEVLESRDGVVSAILPDVKSLIDGIFRLIILGSEPLTGEMLAFIRRRMKLTQEGLAAILGVSRKTIMREEQRKAPIAKAYAAAVRWEFLSSALEVPDKLGSPKDRKAMIRLHAALAIGTKPKSVGKLRVSKNITVNLLQ